MEDQSITAEELDLNAERRTERVSKRQSISCQKVTVVKKESRSKCLENRWCREEYVLATLKKVPWKWLPCVSQ